MAEIAFFVGALVPTFLVSRLLLLATRSWSTGGYSRLALCHGCSLVIASFIGGIGMADGGAFAGLDAAASYAVPQAAWMAFDALRLRRNQPEVTGQKKETAP